MAIPFLVGLVGAAAAGVIGAGGHLCAKDTNEDAQRIIDKSEEKYKKAQKELESVKELCMSNLEELGMSKKHILDTSVTDFLEVYEKLKNVNIQESVGLNEIQNYDIKQEDVVQLKQLGDIYADSISSGAKGVATGALISLAASGALPLMASDLALAGSCVAAGQFSLAAGVLGESLAFGAAMTPLAAVAAPLVLFTGVSASLKADENLEKARQNEEEVNQAVEKMKVSQSLCVALGRRAKIFNILINELDKIFAENVVQLKSRIKDIEKGKKKLCISDLTQKDIEKIAMTRSLAGAIKTIIDTPIISDKGDMTDDSEALIKNLIGYAKNNGMTNVAFMVENECGEV